LLAVWKVDRRTQKAALLEASTEVGLQVDTEGTKYKFMSRHQSAGQNQTLLIANKYCENVAKFKYL